MNITNINRDLVETIEMILYRKFYSKDIFPDKSDINMAVLRSGGICDVEVNNTLETLLTKYFFEKAQVKSVEPKIIKKKSTPWLHKRTEKQAKDLYSKRYESFLRAKGELSPAAIRGIFLTTDKILDLMANPLQTEPFKKKGLVVGNVQSGKTANYLGLINKAADVGYKLIILIAGVHNNLRSQTQKRVNEGFIGFDTLSNTRVGVGLNDGYDVLRPYSFTNLEDDFKATTKRAVNLEIKDANAPVILVVKKQTNTLKNIIEFLRQDESGVRSKDYPLLLIDDEADNASINTKKKPDATTKINSQIREILNLFSKSAYVGFTATPFANIFIDPEKNDDMLGDDLFPEDFIITIEPPSNYIGANEVFTTQRERYIRNVFDDSTYHWDEEYGVHKEMIDSLAVELPDTFKDAICLFLMTIALKKIRMDVRQPHTSMLVNASHLNDVQIDIKFLVEDYLNKIFNLIKFESQKGIDHFTNLEDGKRLYKLWIEEFNAEDSLLNLLSILLDNYAITKVFLINSKSKDKLDYESYSDVGLNAIAIGGYSLSRGFTLEGLTVSYFLRNSKMYDTLLQMGRWFGYREGYADLCRVFLSSAADDWYSYIAGVLKELNEEIGILERHNLTPREYGLKVRNFPGSLLITAKNKMYSGKEQTFTTDFSAYCFQTLFLSADASIISKNLIAVSDFIQEFISDVELTYSDEGDPDGHIWRNMPVDLIEDFIRAFQTHESDLNARLVSKYVSLGRGKELKLWDVYLPASGTGDEYTISNFKVKTQVRTLNEDSPDIIKFNDGGARVVRFFDEKKGLSDAQIEESNKMAAAAGIKQTSRFYRELRDKPLLVLKLFSIKSKGSNSISDIVPAYGISFPKSHEDRSASYVVNKIWFQTNFIDKSEEANLEEEMNDE